MRETLALIMPVYNESAVVGEVLSHWESMLGGLGVDYRIYAYNDGSKDNSLAILNAYAAMPGHQVTVIDQPNSGHGPTILRGYRECCTRYDWLFQLDSDDEIAPSEFVKLWELRADHDFVIGLRAGRQQNWARLVISKVSVGAAKLLYGCRVSDVNCPFRLMRSSAFAALFAEVPGDSFAPNVMLSSLASYHGLRSIETPVAQCNRRTGEVSIRSFKLARSAALSFWQLFALRFRLIKHPKLLQLSVLSLVLALVCLLIPERQEPVSLAGYSAPAGVSVFDFYAKQPLESIQQIELEIVWRLKKIPAADEALFALPNAKLEINPAGLAALGELRPGQVYACKLHLYDDFGVLYGGVPPELKELSRQIGRAKYIKTDVSQLLLINDDLVELQSLQGQITVDSLLPKILSALLAALGTILAVNFCLKSSGAAPDHLERRKLAVIAATVVAGLAVALAVCRGYQMMGRGFPYDTFLFFASDRFHDLYNTFMVTRFWEMPYLEAAQWSSYFPLTYVLLGTFPTANLNYVIFFSFTVFLSFYLISAFVICRYRGWLAVGGLLAVLLLNYPLWFMLDRGNTDFLVYFFIFLFAWCYRNKHDWWAILFLICAVNLKLYPAILAVLYLKDRAYRKFFAAAVGSAAVFLACLAAYHWNYRGLLDSLQRYHDYYVNSMEGVIYGHSLYGLVKVTANRLWNVRDFALFEHIHLYVAALLAAGVSSYVIWVEKVFWKNLYLLLAMMLLLPHVSFDYRMIVLVIPVLYFLADDSDEKNWLGYSLFFGFLLIPIHWVFAYRDTQLSVFARPVLLSALALWIMIDGLSKYRQKR